MSKKFKKNIMDIQNIIIKYFNSKMKMLVIRIIFNNSIITINNQTITVIIICKIN